MKRWKWNIAVVLLLPLFVVCCYRWLHRTAVGLHSAETGYADYDDSDYDWYDLSNTTDQDETELKQPVKLSQEVVNGIKKFVFFIGYPRSGHSIIGSMMDAHPNMVIAHEFMLFKKLSQGSQRSQLKNKTFLFNKLYWDSYKDAHRGWRSTSEQNKGYTLEINSPWQGTFEHLKVIGDKSGGVTVMNYMASPIRFQQHYRFLQQTLDNIPIHVIHVVRNPYDMIATCTLYKAAVKHDLHGSKHKASETHKFNTPTLLKSKAHQVRLFAGAVQRMIHTFHLNVLEVHAEELIRDPKLTIQRICGFLEVTCPEDYLQQCYDKTYKSVSRTRDTVSWSSAALAFVSDMIREYSFFRRYSFEKDFWSE